VDCLFNVIWMDARGRNEKAYRQTYETLREHLDKPIATWIYGPSMAAISAMKQDLESMGFPVFATPEACVRALGLAYQYAASRNR
jgi:acyl-CoA synthetase (NDP forming)